MLRKKVLKAGFGWGLGLALPLSALAQVPQPLVTMEPTAAATVAGTQPAGQLLQQGGQVVTVPVSGVSTMPREVGGGLLSSGNGTVQTLSAVGQRQSVLHSLSQPAMGATAAPASGTVIVANGEGPGCGISTVCAPCSGRPHLWLRGEILYWWTKEQSLPPLVTTGDETSVGRLGFESTQVLFGGRQTEDGRPGFRLTAGSWFGVEDPFHCTNRCLGMEASLFWLSDPNDTFQVFSEGTPILVRPIINALTGQAGFEQVANPPLTVPGLGTLDPLAGGVTIRQTSQLLGAEINGLCRCSEKPDRTLDLIGGLRFLSLKETLDIQEDLIDPTILGTITVQDSFRTQNRFYGAQVGVRSERRFGNLMLEVTGKVALGSTREEVTIDGYTTIRLPDGTTPVARGGLLALDQTNIGKFDRDVLTVVPEITVNASYMVNDSFRVFLGYNFLYWSNVTRPGNNIDIVVNPNFLPSIDPANPPSREGQSRPTLLFGGGDFWVMGLNLGAELRF